jgi:hypothetical protein
MKIDHNAILLAFGVGTALLAACSADSHRTSSSVSTPSDGQHGTIGMSLQLAPGITLSSVQYTITNPGLAGFSPIVNTVDVSGSQAISFQVTLPAASGYTISLSAIDDSGDQCAGGPATFTVLGGQTNDVALNLICQRTVDGGIVGPDVNIGTVIVNGDASLQTTVLGGTCAAVSSLSVSPAETAVGSTITLAAVGIDPSNQTSDVTLTWSATGGVGSLTGATGTGNTFTCASGGTETITVTAAISGGGASCAGTGSLSSTVICDGPVADAGTPVPDSGGGGTPDTGTGTPDTGTGGGPLAPCTTAGQTNCVQCQGNNSGLCTATEALFVQHDIDKGIATAAGPDPSSACYSCLFNADCIDNDAFGDTGKECGDAIQTFGTAAECSAVVSCILGSNCAASAVAPCYCGTLGLATTCQGTSGVAVNGACDTVIAAGLGFPVGDGTDNTAKLENSAFASGRADQIFQCGVVANGCSACQQ